MTPSFGYAHNIAGPSVKAYREQHSEIIGSSEPPDTPPAYGPASFFWLFRSYFAVYMYCRTVKMHGKYITVFHPSEI